MRRGEGHVDIGDGPPEIPTAPEPLQLGEGERFGEFRLERDALHVVCEGGLEPGPGTPHVDLATTARPVRDHSGVDGRRTDEGVCTVDARLRLGLSLTPDDERHMDDDLIPDWPIVQDRLGPTVGRTTKVQARPVHGFAVPAIDPAPILESPKGRDAGDEDRRILVRRGRFGGEGGSIDE